MALELLAQEHPRHLLGPLGQRHGAKITANLAGIFFLRQAKGGADGEHLHRCGLLHHHGLSMGIDLHERSHGVGIFRPDRKRSTDTRNYRLSGTQITDHPIAVFQGVQFVGSVV